MTLKTLLQKSAPKATNKPQPIAARLPTPHVRVDIQPDVTTQLANAQRFGYTIDQIAIERPAPIQRRVIDGTKLEEEEQNKQTAQMKSAKAQVQAEETAKVSTNQTGLPDQLKAGIEALSGYSLDDVQVHYNSEKPAPLGALAYTQGTDIHVAPGQERFLGHEAWHVVQQKQGRVQPTFQAKGALINDDRGLEREADEMGNRANRGRIDISHKVNKTGEVSTGALMQRKMRGTSVIQRGTATDLAAAQQNRAYMVAEMALLNTAGGNVYNGINGAGAGPIKKSAAAGLRYYWERFIDGFDGKKAEMYEAELIHNNGNVPILSADDFTDPDVRYVGPTGNITAVEIKAINSDTVTNVNTAINNADAQLGNRAATIKQIKIRLESRNNLWPSAVQGHWNQIHNNADLRSWLTQAGIIPNLTHTTLIQIEGINVPYGGVPNMRNFRATIKNDGNVRALGAQVW